MTKKGIRTAGIITTDITANILTAGAGVVVAALFPDTIPYWLASIGIVGKPTFEFICDRIKEKFKGNGGFFSQIQDIYNEEVNSALTKGEVGKKGFIAKYEHFKRYYNVCNEHDEKIMRDFSDDNGMVNYLSSETIKGVIGRYCSELNVDYVIEVANEIKNSCENRINEDLQLYSTYLAIKNCKGIKEFKAIFSERIDRIDEKLDRIIGAVESPKTRLPDNNIVTHSSPIKPSVIFEGREIAKREIMKMAKNEKVVLMNGMGGIGKTEICRHIYEYYKENDKADEVEYLGWLTYKNGLAEMFYGQFKAVNAAEANSPESYKQKVKDYIDTLGKKLLLFVDNANDISEEEANELSSYACRIIMTSRKNEVARFRPYEIKELSPEDCRKIYQDYSEDKKEASIPFIDEIIKLANYHTQTVELLAKTQKNAAYSAEELLEELRKSGFTLIGIKEKIKVNYADETINEIFIEHLSKIFDISKGIPDDEQLKSLKLFSLLAPNEPIGKRKLKEWFSLDSLDSINMLVDSGWLKKSGDVVSIHPVISEVVRYKYPAEYDFAANLVNKLTIELNSSLKNGEGIAVWSKLISHSVFLANCLNGTENSDFAVLLNNIGSVYDDMGEYDKALKYYNKALTIREKVLGTEHPDTATSYNNIGSLYNDMGEYYKALEYYKKDLAICEKVLGEEHPNTATSYNNIGGVYSKMGEYDKALEYYNKALTIVEKVLGTEHPDTATSYNNIATLYYNIGDYPNAIDNMNKALTIVEKVLGTEHPNTATSYNNIGSVYDDMGEYDKALEYYNKALEIKKKVLGTEHPSTATSYNNIGLLYSKMGEYDKALEYYNKALTIREKVLGENHPSTRTIYENIAVIYFEIGDMEKAAEFFEKSKQKN